LRNALQSLYVHTMARSIRDEIFDHGYCFIADFEPKKDSPTVASELGDPVTPWAGRLVQQLIPKQIDTPNTYSGIYGMRQFPFHTDLAHWKQPPRYLMLRCIRGYPQVPTLLIDGKEVVKAVSQDVLSRAVVKARRPQAGSIPLLRLYEQVKDEYLLRWDQTFLQPTNSLAKIARQRVAQILDELQPLQIALCQSGDTLLVDNWRMLHARSPIPIGCEDRCVDRVYLGRII